MANKSGISIYIKGKKSKFDEIYVKNSVEFNSYITGLNAKGVHTL